MNCGRVIGGEKFSYSRGSSAFSADSLRPVSPITRLVAATLSKPATATVTAMLQATRATDQDVTEAVIVAHGSGAESESRSREFFLV